MSLTNKVAEVVLEGAAGGVPFANVFHRYRSSAVNDVQKISIVEDFQTNMLPLIVAVLPTQYAATRVRCRWVDDPLDEYLDVIDTTAGDVATDEYDTIDAFFLQLRTGIRSRSGRGSKHFGPVPETLRANKRATAGAITSLEAIATELLTLRIIDGDGFKYAVWSRLLSDMNATPPVVAVGEINSVRVNATIGTMGRRRETTVFSTVIP